jgi:type I restriction enzyme, S subunit
MRSDYLFYWLLGNETMLLGKVEHTGIGAGKLDTQVLKNLSLALPPLAEQKAIASILGALDDKIELNRRMNATLEGMARALFQSWFVDFDPVRAKLDGRKPEGMDKATAALFPDAFEESSLGPVPKGWTIRALADVIDVKHGFAFEGKYFSDERCGDILLTPGNFAIGGGFKDAKVKYYTGPVPEDYILCDHDLVLTMTDLSKAADTLGYPAMIPPPPMGYRYLHNQRLGKVHITQSNAATPLFLYRLFCSEAYRHEILAGATGTTVKHTSPTRIRAFKSLFPSAGVLEVFEKQLNIWYLLATQNESQSRTLATLRDTLLPKLLSGELSVAHSTITKGDKL